VRAHTHKKILCFINKQMEQVQRHSDQGNFLVMMLGYLSIAFTQLKFKSHSPDVDTSAQISRDINKRTNFWILK